MNQLNENEKAAVAAGLWKPGTCHIDYGLAPVPDMHDPANLWRALENLPDEAYDTRRAGIMDAIMYGNGPELRDRAFAALVALYDAEHPEEI